ncbi:hypothetical protein TYRP_001592 [Tyrophagus putrescentiae]|nr:hypothetical protein TYRP_001592 [Tyrophagus putrescentiae]
MNSSWEDVQSEKGGNKEEKDTNQNKTPGITKLVFIKDQFALGVEHIKFHLIDGHTKNSNQISTIRPKIRCLQCKTQTHIAAKT